MHHLTNNAGQTPGARYDTIPFTRADFKRNLSEWQTAIEGTDAWTTSFLENHDQGRCISRFGSDKPEHREQAGKMFAMILATLTGTLFIYQGQEIGMINAPRSWPAEEYKCIKAISYYNMIRAKTNDDPAALSRALDGMAVVARDHARVPMQWSNTENAGFCEPTAKPWMRVIESYEEINVDDQVDREDSVLEFYKRMLRLRKDHKSLFVYGKFETIEGVDDLMVFTKENGKSKSLTVANLSNTPINWKVPSSLSDLGMTLLIGNHGGSDNILGPYEARVYINSS